MTSPPSGAHSIATHCAPPSGTGGAAQRAYCAARQSCVGGKGGGKPAPARSDVAPLLLASCMHHIVTFADL